VCVVLMYYVLLFIIIEPSFGLSVGFWIFTDLSLDLNFHPNRFLSWVWVLGLGALTLHPIRIRPIAIPSLNSNCILTCTEQYNREKERPGREAHAHR
jgi:hypothetical protein